MMPKTSLARLPDGRPFGRHDASWVAPDRRLTDRAGVPTVEPTDPSVCPAAQPPGAPHVPPRAPEAEAARRPSGRCGASSGRSSARRVAGL